ncbi:UNVERIFIED_CONTAM: Oleosin [Sesamum radiatum]|uniref:Oleosin n=1 Tax=Sesamum radiatum TaxID=300843 RepID=A0AAW2RBW6_SESRA
MADRDRPHPHQIQVHPQQPHRYEGVKSLLPQKGPSTTQILAIITLLPISGTLLCLAGITLVGTLIGLAVATPVFVIFSPVLVPAAILIAGASRRFDVRGFWADGAFVAFLGFEFIQTGDGAGAVGLREATRAGGDYVCGREDEASGRRD